jgi:hypothetical protein
MKSINTIILKIRDFIIGFRFKKFGHKNNRLDDLKKRSLFDARIVLKSCLAYSTAVAGAFMLRQIQLTPAVTADEKIKKAVAIAQCIINTNTGICKAWAMF